MSRLKRKKLTAVESKCESKVVIRDDQESVCRPEGASTNRTCTSAGSGPWWSAADLTEMEKLWALTLQDFCPAAFNSPAMPSCVPELPQAPMSTREEKSTEWRWCSLDEDVSELPVLNEPQGCVPIQSGHHFTLNEGEHQPGSSSAEQLSQARSEGQTLTSSQEHPEENPKKSLGDASLLWKVYGEPSSSEDRQWKWDGDGSKLLKRTGNSGGAGARRKIGPHGDPQTFGSHGDGSHGTIPTCLRERKWVGSESGRRPGSGLSGLECDNKAKTGTSSVGPKSGITVSTKGPTGKVGTGVREASGSGVSSLENDFDCRPGTSKGGPGIAEAKLECCPMCLMPFPAGFSQMECDGHLAQCLSEMNTDVVW